MFLEKSYVKYGRETIPRSLSKKIKIEHISITSLKFYKFAFITCEVEGYRNIFYLI